MDPNSAFALVRDSILAGVTVLALIGCVVMFRIMQQAVNSRVADVKEYAKALEAQNDKDRARQEANDGKLDVLINTIAGVPLALDKMRVSQEDFSRKQEELSRSFSGTIRELIGMKRGASGANFPAVKG